MTEYADFEDFWPHFLQDHWSPATRWAHVAGLASAVVGVSAALASRRAAPLLLGGALFAAFAVGSHPAFQGDRPQNFRRPWFGARGFARLCVRTVTGEAERELEALRRAAQAREAAAPAVALS